MKPIILAALLLGGCGTVSAIAQRAVFPAAAGVETRVGANCIRAAEAGRIISAVPALITQNARDVFDVSLGQRLTPAEQAALARIRARTDAHCPQMPAVPAQ